MGSSHERVEGGSGGVMRRLAAGSKGGGFGSVFQFVDALFSPSKSASYVERQESRRRKIAVPAPGDPPVDDEDPYDGYGAPDDATALPRNLLGPVEPVELVDDSHVPDGLGTPPSARGEHPPSGLE